MMIRLPLYFARLYIVWLCVILGGLMGIAFIGETLELLRRASVHSNITYGMILTMASLKLPGTMQIVLPSVALFSGLYFFWRLTKSNELDVTRAAGLSVWNFLMPVVGAALLLGVVEMTILNPLSAAMVSRYDRMEDKYFRGQSAQLNLSSSGVWISESGPQGKVFIHADTIDSDHFTLEDVTFFQNPDDFAKSIRFDAKKAKLTNGAWLLSDVRKQGRGQKEDHLSELTFPTELTPEKIEESFAPPSTLSFWQLPGFIRQLDEAGLSSLRHRLYFQSLLARPFLLAAMVVLSAVFGLQRTRGGGIFKTIVLGLILGLFLFVLNDVIQTIAQSGALPIPLAAWGPAFLGLLGGAAALFYSEDG